MKSKAIFAFSADPIHFGHLDIIKRAAQQFDLMVLVANSPKKNYMFTLEERLKMVGNVVKPWIDSNSVQALNHGKLTADFAFENNIPAIIRGIRNFSDWDYEKLLRDVNISQQHGVETYFLSCDPKLSHISSTAVKELYNHAGFIHEYVPLSVKREIERKNEVYIVGVTGNIASGKNWVCDQIVYGESRSPIAYHPVHHIDLDKLAHQILFESNVPLHIEVRKEIRRSFLSNDGLVDSPLTPDERKSLGDIVFAHADKRAKLNDIMYQPLLTLLRQNLQGKKGIILINAALLAEFKLTHICNNQVILVTTDVDTRIERMRKREYSETQIANRLASQYTDDRKMFHIKRAIERDGFGKVLLVCNDRYTPWTSSVLIDMIMRNFVK